MSNDNDVGFPGHTWLNIDPNSVLESAVDQVDMVIVIGEDKEGGVYTASSTADKGKILLMLEEAKFKLLRGDFG